MLVLQVVVSDIKATCSNNQGNEASFQVVVQEIKRTGLVFRTSFDMSRQRVGEIKATCNLLTRQRGGGGIFQGHRSINLGNRACHQVMVRKNNSTSSSNQGNMASSLVVVRATKLTY